MPQTLRHANPRVSVCIPVRNRTSYLRACLASVVAQTFENIEIIVVDNASEEALESVVSAFQDPRIRYYRNDTDIGANANFRKAASYAKGELLKFVCSDDLLLPNCVETCSRDMHNYPDASGAVFRSAIYDDRADALRWVSVLPFQGLAAGLEPRGNTLVYHYTAISPTSTIYRRSVFEALGGFDARLEAVIDWDMYAKMLRTSGGVLFMNEVLAITRVHDSNDATHQARTGGFFRDMLRIAQGEGRVWKLDVSDAIWRELMLHRTYGDLFLVVKQAAAAGFMPRFVISLPRLAARHLWRSVRSRTLNAEAAIDSSSVSPVEAKSLQDAWQAARLSAQGHN